MSKKKIDKIEETKIVSTPKKNKVTEKSNDNSIINSKVTEKNNDISIINKKVTNRPIIKEFVKKDDETNDNFIDTKLSVKNELNDKPEIVKNPILDSDKCLDGVKIESMNPKVLSLLSDISDKLNKLIYHINEKKENKQEYIGIENLSFYELKFLKDYANEIVILNRYPGGNQQLTSSALNLVRKIDLEIMNRLKPYLQ